MSACGSRHLLPALVAATVLLSPLHAKAGQCPDFYTESEPWRSVDHQSTQRIVESRFKGDWNSFIERWNRLLTKVIEAKREERGYWIRKNLFVEPKKLGHYIDVLKWQIAVIRCLADDPK